MIVGLFIVKPVPVYPSSSRASIDGYDPIPTGDGVVFVGEAPVALDLEGDVEGEEEADSVPLVPLDQEPSSYQVPVPPSAVQLTSFSASLHHERCVGDKDGLPDIHGKQLWVTPDFYLVFVIIGICG